MGNISIVIPVHNEAESLAELIERVVRVTENRGLGEIVCVDDGSSDGTDAVLQKLKTSYPQLKIVRFAQSHGQPAALAAGIRAAHGDVVVTLDADLQNPPEAIPILLENLDGVDAVVGWRQGRRDPLVKIIGSKIANTARRLVLRDRFHDNGCTMKAFRKKIVDDLPVFNHSTLFFANLAQLAGYKVREVRVPHAPRKYGRSKYGQLSFAWRSVCQDMFLVRAMQKRKSAGCGVEVPA